MNPTNNKHENINQLYNTILKETITKANHLEINDFPKNAVRGQLKLWTEFKEGPEVELIKANDKKIFKKIQSYFTVLNEIQIFKEELLPRLIENAAHEILDNSKDLPDPQKQIDLFLRIYSERFNLFTKLNKGLDLDSQNKEFRERLKTMYGGGIEKLSPLLIDENKAIFEKIIDKVLNYSECKKAKNSLIEFKKLKADLPSEIKKRIVKNTNGGFWNKFKFVLSIVLSLVILCYYLYSVGIFNVFFPEEINITIESKLNPITLLHNFQTDTQPELCPFYFNLINNDTKAYVIKPPLILKSQNRERIRIINTCDEGAIANWGTTLELGQVKEMCIYLEVPEAELITENLSANISTNYGSKLVENFVTITWQRDKKLPQDICAASWPL